MMAIVESSLIIC